VKQQIADRLADRASIRLSSISDGLKWIKRSLLMIIVI
jgi:hypothetical protein